MGIYWFSLVVLKSFEEFFFFFSGVSGLTLMFIGFISLIDGRICFLV